MSEDKQFVEFVFRGVVDSNKAKELLEAFACDAARSERVNSERYVAITGDEDGWIKRDYVGPPCVSVELFPKHIEQFMRLLSEE